LRDLPRYNGVTLHQDFFNAAMVRLRTRFLKEPAQGVITPAPPQDAPVVEKKIVEAERQAQTLAPQIINRIGMNKKRLLVWSTVVSLPLLALFLYPVLIGVESMQIPARKPRMADSPPVLARSTDSPPVLARSTDSPPVLARSTDSPSTTPSQPAPESPQAKENIQPEKSPMAASPPPTSSQQMPESPQAKEVIVLSKGGHIRIPNLTHREVAVCDQESSCRHFGDTVEKISPKTKILKVPAGIYKLRFDWHYLQNVKVEKEKTTDIHIGVINMPKLSGSRAVEVCALGGECGRYMEGWAGSITPETKSLEVPAGVYRLKWGQQDLGNITVREGSTVTVEQ
jgi:hypothetical protein